MKAKPEITTLGKFKGHLSVAVFLVATAETSACPEKSLICGAFARSMTILLSPLSALIVPGMRQKPRGVIKKKSFTSSGVLVNGFSKKKSPDL